jgi:hypothetical protein
MAESKTERVSLQIQGDMTPPVAADAAVPMNSNLAKRRDNMTAAQLQTVADMKKLAAAQTADVKALKTPETPDLKKFDQPFPEPDPIKSFGSWASALGILAGALTRQPLTSALNASAAAMKAIRATDLDRYAEAKAAWKENIDLAIKHSDLEWKAYNAAFDKIKEGYGPAWAALKEASATYGNVAMQSETQLEHAQSIALRQQEATLRATETAARLGEITRPLDQARVEAKTRWAAEGHTDKEWDELPNERKNALIVKAGQDIAVNIKLAEMRPSPGMLKEGDVDRIAKDKFHEKFNREPNPTDLKDATELSKLKAEVRRTTASSGIDQRFTARVLGSARQAVSDLANISDLPVSTRDWFGSVVVGPGLLDAGQNALIKEMTSEESRAYQGYLAGLNRALATMETQGTVPSGTFTAAFDPLKLQPGDSYLTVLRNMALMRQVADNALEVLAVKPSTTEEERAEINKLLEQLHEVVPYVVRDVNKVEFSKDETVSIRDSARKTLPSAALAAPGAAPAAPGAAPAETPWLSDPVRGGN